MTLVAFDFDGTLSADEMIVLLGEAAGAADEIAAITERAMAGELSFGESLRNRVALLEGVSNDAAERAFDRIELRPGTADLLGLLAETDTRTAILTGGFETGVERALENAGVSVDRIVANRLPLTDGSLTGTVEGPLIEGEKDEALASVATDMSMSFDETIAVGDGANDVPMLQWAGFAIGYRPKVGVEEYCDTTVDSMTELQSLFQSRNVV